MNSSSPVPNATKHQRGSRHSTFDSTLRSSHLKVEVRLLQMHPIQPHSRMSDRSRHFVLDDSHPSVVLGRASKNRQLVPGPSNLWLDSPIITKEHARFIRGQSAQEPLLLRDLNSTHGTEVAGKKIYTDTPVISGDVVKFGEHLTNGPLNFEPTTFLVEYDVKPVNLPPSPDSFTSGPSRASQHASQNRFAAPYDSDDEDTDNDSLPGYNASSDRSYDQASEMVPESVAIYAAEDASDVSFSDAEFEVDEPQNQVGSPFSDTSSSSASDGEYNLSDEIDEISEPPPVLLPPTQSARGSSSMHVTDSDRRTAESRRTTLMDIKNMIIIPDSPRLSSPAAYSPQSPILQPQGSSPDRPILLDSHEVRNNARTTWQNIYATPSSFAWSTGAAPSGHPPNDNSTRSGEITLERNGTEYLERQPSPSDAALARPQTLVKSASTPLVHDEQVPPHPTTLTGNGNASDSSSPRPYSDGPFRAPEPLPSGEDRSEERARSSVLAIQELIHPSAFTSLSHKRSRDESGIDDNEHIDRTRNPNNGFAVSSTDLHLPGPPLRKVLPRYMAWPATNDWVGTDPIFDDDALNSTNALTTDDEVEDGSGYDSEDLDFDATLNDTRTPFLDELSPEEYESQMKALERNCRCRLLAQADDKDARPSNVSNEDSMATLLKEDGLDLPEVAPTTAECSMPELGSVNDNQITPFSVESLPKAATRLSMEMARDEFSEAPEHVPAAKKMKASHDPLPLPSSRFRGFMNKAVPFMAGAAATAATIFAGAGMLISTMHDELKQEALMDLGL